MNRPLGRLILIIAALALIVVGVSSFQAAERGGKLRLWFFDVGQGDAILIDTPDQQQILIDGGPNAAVLGELAKAMLLTDKTIDLIISTHNDADHLSGLNEVLKHYEVGKIWLTGAIHTTKTYQNFLELVAAKQIPTETVLAGAVIEFGELSGIVISPFVDYEGSIPGKQNIAGIVTFWQYGEQTFLLTADVEAAQEQEMIRRNVLRHATILKVPHHGSTTSSSAAFLEAVTPEVAVIQVGKDNRYNHPAAAVLARLEQYIPTILRSDRDGTIRFELSTASYTYKTGL